MSVPGQPKREKGWEKGVKKRWTSKVIVRVGDRLAHVGPEAPDFGTAKPKARRSARDNAQRDAGHAARRGDDGVGGSERCKVGGEEEDVGAIVQNTQEQGAG